MALQPNECIRLYNEHGEHCLTILLCSDSDNHHDLCDPDGKVLYCGIPDDIVTVIGKNVEIRPIA